MVELSCHRNGRESSDITTLDFSGTSTKFDKTFRDFLLKVYQTKRLKPR